MDCFLKRLFSAWQSILDVCAFLHDVRTVQRFQALCGVQTLPIVSSNPRRNPTIHCDILPPRGVIRYRLVRPWIHRVFIAASLFGSESFYAIYFPMIAWNLDLNVCCKVMLVWGLGMYVGQALKEAVRSPRPTSPPVVYLEHTFLAEYGLPSTHALNAFAIPLSFVLFVQPQCQLSTVFMFVYAFVLPLAISASRVYLGVHRVSDVIVGMAMGVLLCLISVSHIHRIVDAIANQKMPVGGLLLFILVLASVYPKSPNGYVTPTWKDTMATLTGVSSVCLAVSLLATTPFPATNRATHCFIPTVQQFIFDFSTVCARSAVGCVCVFFAVTSYPKIARNWLRPALQFENGKVQTDKNIRVIAEFVLIYMLYMSIGLTLFYVPPCIFKFMNIHVKR